ncbi:MAG: 4Fe-4S dicluster domain-containing protein [Chloroflexota bacterium]|nr:4Fe-4S dicluster domain-containing protein [Chloroflexota bacterium]
MTDKGIQIPFPKAHGRKWSRWRRLRQAVQILALLLFLYLLVVSWSAGEASSLTGLFFQLNPLTALTAMIAGRTWIPNMAWALITVGVTLLLGRAWCGWVCPLGTLLGWIRFPGAYQRATKVSPRWRTVKYILLLLILGMALLGSLALLIFDPITILTRATTTGLLPALNYGITRLETALYQLPLFQPAVSWIEGALRGVVLPSIQSAFSQNLLIFALFAGIIALNGLADRFWCRYLCPLGGLLGLLSRVALFRPFITSQCSSCDHCMSECRMEAIQPSVGHETAPREIIPSECTLCMDCLAVCPASGIDLRWQTPRVLEQEYDPGRRQALISLGAGAASALMLSTEDAAKSPDPRLIRPPGVDDEDEFLSKCIRCGECMQVCATTGLQPSLFEGGLQGVWSPRLVPELGPCDYSCNACGQVCPTGAIPALDLETKRQEVIGMAVIDRNRCLPWAYDTPCIVCEEMCPIPDKAIRVQEVTVIDESGAEMLLQQPYVVLDLCIGCGICEYNCPMEAQAAIQVQRR